MRRLLLPVKGTLHDLRASDVAGLLAREVNGSVTVFNVKGPELMTLEQGKLIDKIRSQLDETYAVEVNYVSVQNQDISGAILAEALKRYEYVVMGATDKEGSEKMVVGSTSGVVFENSPIPVIIVKNVAAGKKG
ncbi:MAG: universal stress protein [archaeon]